MQMILCYANRLRADAMVLAAGIDLMRVMVRGDKDATELRLIEGQWTTEDGRAVGIEALLTEGSLFNAGVIATTALCA